MFTVDLKSKWSSALVELIILRDEYLAKIDDVTVAADERRAAEMAVEAVGEWIAVDLGQKDVEDVREESDRQAFNRAAIDLDGEAFPGEAAHYDGWREGFERARQVVHGA